MIAYLFILIIIFCISMSLRTLFLPNALQDKFLSWESFAYLFFIYSTILLGFGLLYFICMENGIAVIQENEELLSGSTLHTLQTCIYFSGSTLFSVGYGDVTPIGIGRVISILEGMIGYTIPASFVVRTVVDIQQERG
ncbi:potassium channel family protein [Caldibacillus lycopersici]|uniref:Potassium channel family protein n=1 Tax=Perspicuibacillus lycopersici TaxID=1325689 RepID=A0AAE3LP56_9BACI|nr:potassium channel family protein [Perspicuibacillus lycopersici]MCU9614651.1 potassium channel family protein [Perspicuibacillus lycopersici]